MIRIIRPIKIKDIPQLCKFYLSLSSEDRLFFHPFPFTLWILVPIFCYFAIINKINKYVKKIVPKLYTSFIVATDKNGKILGFGFLGNLQKITDHCYEAKSFGVVVDQRYRGMGIGSSIIKKLISIAESANVKRIWLTVLANNNRAINLYKKFNFKIVKYYEGREKWVGQKYKDCDMVLDLCKKNGWDNDVP